jgi:hypothetical protein
MFSKKILFLLVLAHFFPPNMTLTLDWTILFLRDIYIYIYGDLAFQVGGGLEYLHLSPASHKRGHKGNPVPGGITGTPCSWGI